MATFLDLSVTGLNGGETQVCALEAQAERCRQLAGALSDDRTVTTLTGMALEYEAKARALRAELAHCNGHATTAHGQPHNPSSPIGRAPRMGTARPRL